MVGTVDPTATKPAPATWLPIMAWEWYKACKYHKKTNRQTDLTLKPWSQCYKRVKLWTEFVTYWSRWKNSTSDPSPVRLVKGNTRQPGDKLRHIHSMVLSIEWMPFVRSSFTPVSVTPPSPFSSPPPPPPPAGPIVIPVVSKITWGKQCVFLFWLRIRQKFTLFCFTHVGLSFSSIRHCKVPNSNNVWWWTVKHAATLGIGGHQRKE